MVTCRVAEAGAAVSISHWAVARFEYSTTLVADTRLLAV
jgi:hypothetical protein